MNNENSEAAVTRSYIYGLLGWILALCLLVLGYIQTRNSSDQIMSLLRDNIATRIEVLESRDILPRAEREIAVLRAKVASLETEVAMHRVYASRLERLEDDVASRANIRWNLPDQIKWVEEFRKRNPSLDVPASKAEKPTTPKVRE